MASVDMIKKDFMGIISKLKKGKVYVIIIKSYSLYL